MNVIAQLDFELAYSEVAFQKISHYTKGIPSPNISYEDH